ncbi:MAG: DUF2147 domain-containing protein [Chlorobi bacterium]|nr:DUF2147 domain-containing protein [Chlorobiota bacterium]
MIYGFGGGLMMMLIKKRFMHTLILLVLSAGTLLAQKADDILGKYRLPNGIDIEIYKNGNVYDGKIIALNNYDNGETKDIHNPDKSKRDEPLMNKVIIRGLEFDKDEKQWVNGLMYGPDKGIDLNLKVTEINDGEIVVVGSKYFFSKTLKWKKIN